MARVRVRRLQPKVAVWKRPLGAFYGSGTFASAPLRMDKFASSPTVPSVTGNLVKFAFDKWFTAQSRIDFYHNETMSFLDSGSGISEKGRRLDFVTTADQKKLEEIRKGRFRTLEEVDPYLQEKAKEVSDAWKNQPPTSLSNALAQIHRNMGR